MFIKIRQKEIIHNLAFQRNIINLKVRNPKNLPVSSLAPIVHVDSLGGDSVSRDARDEDVVDPKEACISRGSDDPGLDIRRSNFTGRSDRMSHRKWRESKQHPSRAS